MDRQSKRRLLSEEIRRLNGMTHLEILSVALQMMEAGLVEDLETAYVYMLELEKPDGDAVE